MSSDVNPKRERGACSDGGDASRGAPFLAGLSEAQQQRLTDLLDHYLRAQERGLPLSQESLLAANPDLADALRGYFHSLGELHELAAGFSFSAAAEPAASGGGERLGDFELIREIGRGGMGVVYEARQLSLDRRVAVKLLPFAAILDSRQIARFKHEAQAAAQLHHPNIVPVFAIGVERGVHYYAMQYIDGQPLDVAIGELRGTAKFRVPSSEFRVSDSTVSWNAAKFRVQSSEFKVDASNLTQDPEPGTRNSAETQPHALLSTRRQFDERGFFKQVAELGVQAAQALAAAHEQGVVHRDIKPSNLLLETGGKLWVTDFGLARFQRDVSLTRTGDLIGTLRYMSPEQASGQAALVDHRTDIYSLGATLYELACLRPAFGEAEGPALLARIAAEEPRQPRQIRHEIPVDLETVILKAMAKEREHRYATAQQFAEDLRCIAEGRPPLARPPVLLARARTWVRRRRRLVGAVACVLLVACAGVAASASLIARERTKAARRVSVADQKFQATGAKNQVLARDVALAYDRLGAAHSALREPAAARESYERAIAMQQELIAKSRGDAAVQRDLAVSWNNLGLLDCRAGRVEEAEAAMRRALAILTKLVRQQPGSAALASDLGGTYANLGIVLEKRGATDLARQSYADAIEHQQLAIELAPETARYREMLAQHEQHQARVSKKPIGGSL